MLVRIYDTNNWVRVVLENNPLGMRALWNEVLRSKGDIKIFCFEGKNGNQLRRNLYPEYKMTREAPVDNFFENLKFFKELLRHAPKNVAVSWADGYEADDVINFYAQTFKDKQIEIMSTDRDLTQIAFAKFPMIKKELVEDRKFVRTYKTMVGDPSDNIKGVARFGKSSWENNKSHWSFFRDWCEACYNGVRLDLNGVDLPDKIKKVLNEEDINQVGVYWKITGFYKPDKINTYFGDGDLSFTENELRRYLL